MRREGIRYHIRHNNTIKKNPGYRKMYETKPVNTIEINLSDEEQKFSDIKISLDKKKRWELEQFNDLPIVHESYYYSHNDRTNKGYYLKDGEKINTIVYNGRHKDKNKDMYIIYNPAECINKFRHSAGHRKFPGENRTLIRKNRGKKNGKDRTIRGIVDAYVN